MKKIFFVVAVVATVGIFTSCKDKNKVTCWEVKQNLTGITVGYVWGTKAEAEAEYLNGVGFKFNEVDKSEADCKGGLFE
ncbi:MAG: hypothetical protein LBN95_00765 [Prevotellaceae bacterium]|jgi:hypothetical protein|nr:hypothetical protein [Prevotellaceae bacterium]